MLFADPQHGMDFPVIQGVAFLPMREILEEHTGDCRRYTYFFERCGRLPHVIQDPLVGHHKGRSPAGSGVLGAGDVWYFCDHGVLTRIGENKMNVAVILAYEGDDRAGDADGLLLECQACGCVADGDAREAVLRGDAAHRRGPVNCGNVSIRQVLD